MWEVNMAYDNLRAEMTRHGKTHSDMAELLKISTVSVSNKINHKKKFTLDEAFTVQREWFPDCTIEYLFRGRLEKAAS
jgi:plasmid maintenance system antidote protein VapI